MARPAASADDAVTAMHTLRRDRRLQLLLLVVIAVPAAALLIDPIPQDPTYHLFADRRTLLGVPHFWNVASNLPFLVVGAVGLALLSGRRWPLQADLSFLYPALFMALLLTGFGSAAYHLAPSNTSLVWDRVGITLAIATLCCIVLGEHVSARLARRLFAPLVTAGTATVAWWVWTESRMAGDLRPYALFQFMPMLLIPLVLLLYPSRYDRTAFLWWVIAMYALAKVCEIFDAGLFALAGFISGHSLKHVIAALAMAVFVHGLAMRRAAPTEGDSVEPP
jgi:hypothetical protein